MAQAKFGGHTTISSPDIVWVADNIEIVDCVECDEAAAGEEESN